MGRCRVLGGSGANFTFEMSWFGTLVIPGALGATCGVLGAKCGLVAYPGGGMKAGLVVVEISLWSAMVGDCCRLETVESTAGWWQELVESAAALWQKTFESIGGPDGPGGSGVVLPWP